MVDFRLNSGVRRDNIHFSLMDAVFVYNALSHILTVVLPKAQAL